MKIKIYRGFQNGKPLRFFKEIKKIDIKTRKGFHYGESGVSHNRCMETYCGPEAFSEVEICKMFKNLQLFIVFD